MTGRIRSALLVLLSVLLTLPVVSDRAAGLQSPFRTAQVAEPGPGGEPPLADGAAPAMPRAEVPGVPGGPPVDPPMPQVSIKVRVAAVTAAGKELEYRILVENCGKAPAHHVFVRAPVPTNAEFDRAVPAPKDREPELRWSLGTLPACGKQEITLVVRPTGAGDVRCTARVLYEHGQTVVTRLGKADLQLRLGAPDRASVNDLKPVTLEVTNLGQAPAANVVVTAKVPDGLGISRPEPPEAEGKPLTWELGTLAPGQSRTVKFDLRPRQAGAFVLRAEASAGGGVVKEASASVLVGEAKLSLVMTGPERRFVGGAATYQITVVNTGTMPATNVLVEDVLPEPVQLVTAVPMPQALAYEGSDVEGKRVTGVRLRWLLGTLAPGDRRTLQLTVRVLKSDGEFRNRVAARADRDLFGDAEVVTIFEGASGLTVEIDKSQDPLEAGRRGDYRVRVRNRGNGAATNVGVVVTMPEQLQVLEANGKTGGKQDGNVVRFDALPRLEAGGEAVYTLSAQALPPGAPTVRVRLRVEVTADQLEAGKPLRTEDSVTIYAPPAPRP